MGCAAIVAVQKVYREDNLLENVNKMGKVLEKALHEALDDSPIVGNIRGRGLFWGIEFVKDKATKEPFDPSELICVKVHERALELGVSIYPGNGCAGNGRGDQVMVSPPFNITEEEIRFAVDTLAQAVGDVARSLQK
jgi:adenosylmethionine-8-amino-7-oxononanoate aminotransferase